MWSTGQQGADPAGMHIGQHLTALGLAQERDHANHDQQRFQPLAHQDGEAAEERRGRVRVRILQHCLGAIEQGVDLCCPAWRCPPAPCGGPAGCGSGPWRIRSRAAALRCAWPGSARLAPRRPGRPTTPTSRRARYRRRRRHALAVGQALPRQRQGTGTRHRVVDGLRPGTQVGNDGVGLFGGQRREIGFTGAGQCFQRGDAAMRVGVLAPERLAVGAGLRRMAELPT